MKILLIEDSGELSDVLMEVFRLNGILAVSERDGKRGFDEAQKPGYDTIVLDLMLPSMDGMDIIAELRRRDIQTPILILSARAQVEDKVRALSLGADDYLTKPFSTKELLARINALARRRGVIEDSKVGYGDIVLDTATHELVKGEARIGLSLREYELIKALLDAKGGLVGRDFLDQKVWGYDGPNMYNGVEVYASFIRRKLKALGCTTEIKASRGSGYRLYNAGTQQRNKR